MVEEKFISIFNDFAFKTLLLLENIDINNFFRRIIIYFTNKDINDYILYYNELKKLNYKSIANKTDILMISKKDNSKINIELNRTYSKTTINKNNTYLFKLAGDYYNGCERKKLYKENIDVIQINFNNYKNKSNKSILQSFKKLYDYKNKLENKSIKMFDIYLPNVNKNCYNKENDIFNDLAMFLCKSYKEMEELILNNKERRTVMEALKRLGRDYKFIEYYDYKEYEEALKRNLKVEGYEEGQEEFAINMYNKNISPDIICECLKISKKELKEILASNKLN